MKILSISLVFHINIINILRFVNVGVFMNFFLIIEALLVGKMVHYTRVPNVHD